MTQKINSRKRTTDAAKRRGTPSLSPLFLLLKSIIDVTALVRNSTVHEQFLLQPIEQYTGFLKVTDSLQSCQAKYNFKNRNMKVIKPVGC